MKSIPSNPYRPTASLRGRLAERPAVAAGIAAAPFASALAWRFAPLSAADPFHDTLALLPVLVAGFALLALWTEARGGRRLTRRGSTIEGAILIGLVVLTLARPSFAVAGSAEALAAGYLLLLGHRVLRQTLSARPLLGRQLPSRPSPVFFALPLLAYLALLPWSTAHREPDGDEPYNLLLTHSLAYDGDADLSNNYRQGDWRFFMSRPLAPQPGDPVGPHGELYSRHNMLLPLVLAPAYRVFGKAGALAMMALMTAALAWMVLRLGRHYAPNQPGATLVAFGLVAFASPLPLYSYQVWVEVPAALLALIALDSILMLPRIPTSRQWWTIAVALVLLPLLKIRFMLISLPLLAFGWWRSGRRRLPLLIGGVLLTMVGGAIAFHNIQRFGNPLKVHSWQELNPGTKSAGDYGEGFFGLFFDSAFGLFPTTPIWLLLLPATVLLIRRRQSILLHLSVLAAPYLFIVAPRGEWYGGWSPPFRYALLALPLLGLGMVPLLTERRRPGARLLIAALGSLTAILLMIWIIVPGWTYSFADGRSMLLDALSRRIGNDAARFFPSFIRPRLANWIWPPAAAFLLTAVWGWRRRPRVPVATRSWQLSGIACALLAAAIVPLAAWHVPTRVVEIEDPSVEKTGGHLYPDRWTIERAQYRGSWVLRIGEEARAPVVPGGKRVRLDLAAEFIRNQRVPFTIELRAGSHTLGYWTPTQERVWKTIHCGPVDWPAGAPLVLAAHGAAPPGAENGALIDRVDFHWE
jgi:hypothetical protein